MLLSIINADMTLTMAAFLRHEHFTLAYKNALKL